MTIATEVTLSVEQRAVVDSQEPALLVLASAGTGKTEVVARRIERLLTDHEAAPGRVLALSYTNKASNELRERFDTRLGSKAKQVDAETLHGFAHGLLRRSGTWIGLPAEPEILTRDEDRVTLLRDFLVERGQDPDADQLRKALRELDLARARRVSLPSLADDWQDAMEAVGALDYEGLHERATELLDVPAARRRLGRMYDHIVVDEAQNLSRSQYRLLAAVFGPPPLASMTVMLVGDDKQSLIRFAGGDKRILHTFANEYDASTYRLTRNYRSAAKIAKLGGVLARELKHSEPESSELTYPASGDVRVLELLDESDEAMHVASWVCGLLDNGLLESVLAPGEATGVRPEEIAVLGRSSASLRATELALEERGIQTTTSVNLDDLLVTDLGRAAVEVIGLKGADHIAPRWELGRLLDVDNDVTHEISTIREHLLNRVDAFTSLVALIDLDHPDQLIDILKKVGQADDATWHGDRLQLSDAWARYALGTDRGSRTWGGFRLFLTRLQRGNDLAKGVRLLTIAKSQGREYRAVAVVGLNDGQLPDFRATTEAEMNEELSNFYVAVTRASRALVLTRPKERATRYGSRKQTRSPYLSMVPDSIIDR